MTSDKTVTLTGLIALALVVTGATFLATRVFGDRMRGHVQGRSNPIATAPTHAIFNTSLKGPFPQGTAQAMFGMGCFWGAERYFWQTPGVVSTSVGYAGGSSPNPTYDEVCSGGTGHAEVVHVVYDPNRVTYEQLLRLFFENHDPTQGNRQGNDVGSQYRSIVLAHDAQQKREAAEVLARYQAALTAQGHGRITTEITDWAPYYYAEAYHQQYLEKNPNGYCGHGGTGVTCPLPIGEAHAATTSDAPARDARTRPSPH